MLILVLANLALPFLLFYLRNAVYKVYYLLVLKDKVKKVPSLDVKLGLKLLACGIVLLTSVLVYYRLQIEPQARGERNEVQQYNFR
jgi:hypothetical protein